MDLSSTSKRHSAGSSSHNNSVGNDVRRFDNRGGIIVNNDTLTTITSQDTISDVQSGDVEYLGRSKAGSEDEDDDIFTLEEGRTVREVQLYLKYIWTISSVPPTDH